MRCFTEKTGRGFARFVAPGVAAFSLAARLSACPFCKLSLDSGAARGYNWSILLMLAAPAGTAGIISSVIWRASRRAKRLRQKAEVSLR